MMRVLVMIVALLIGWCSEMSASITPPKSEAVIGVLAFRSKEQTIQDWEPLARYLETKIPDVSFRILPLAYGEFDDAVQKGGLSFVFTNPEHYVYLSIQYDATRIATLIRANVAGKPLQEFGGVIITRASRKDIATIDDLKGKKIAAVDRMSLGGYLSQAAVLENEGLNLSTDLSMTFTDMPHDKVVRAVEKGEADAGFIRSSVLEKMAREGKIRPKDFKVLHRVDGNGFPQALSTPLYPEWPFASLHDTDPQLANRVAVALLSLPYDSDTAKSAGYYGWNIPLSYENVRMLMIQMRVKPYDTVPKFTFEDVIEKYGIIIISTMTLAITLLAAMIIRMFLLTAKLRRNTAKLEDEIAMRQLAERHLKRAASVFHNSGEGIVITDRDRFIIDVNEAFCEITGYQVEELIGKKTSILRSNRHDDAFYNSLNNALNTLGKWRGEIWNRKKDGEVYAEYLRIDSTRDNNGKIENYIGIVSDITEEKMQEEQLHRMANYDPLTNLANRRMFTQMAEQILHLTQRKGLKAVVAFIDLDGFKEINDHHGHAIGDRVLKKVAMRLEQQMRKSDFIGRIGGDEFVALLADIKTFNDADQMLERVLASLKEPIHIDSMTVSVGASIGATFYPDDNDEIEMLIRHADTAMYQAKAQGRNRIVYFDPLHKV